MVMLGSCPGMFLTEATGNSTHWGQPDALSTSQYLQSRQDLSKLVSAGLGTSGVVARSTVMAKVDHVGVGRHDKKVAVLEIRTASHVTKAMMMRMMWFMIRVYESEPCRRT